MTPNAGFTNGWTAEIERLRAENERLTMGLTAEMEIASQFMGLASRWEARATAAEGKVSALEVENARMKEENQRLRNRCKSYWKEERGLNQ